MLLSHFMDEEAEAQPVCTTLKALLREEGARPESWGSCLRSLAHIRGLRQSPGVHSSLPCKPDGPVETHGVGRCSLTSGPGAKLCSPALGPATLGQRLGQLQRRMGLLLPVCPTSLSPPVLTPAA